MNGNPAAPRYVAILATGLVSALLPLVAAPPAQAAPETCPQEAYEAPLFLTGCDDTQPPTTTLVSVSPEPNATGFTRSSSVTMTFSGAHAGDGDNGVIGFQCQLFATDPATPPTVWQTCASPHTYTDLDEFTTTPYTFRVRAVDTTDEAIAARGSNPLAPPNTSEHDWDETPAVATFKIDSLAPNTFLTTLPTDSIRPDQPVVLSQDVTFGLNSNEAGTFSCTLNGTAFTPCEAGQVRLERLKPGPTTFVARAVDRASNIDPTPATASFFVPSDIKGDRKAGWSTVRKVGKGFFDQDYVEARKVGATLVITKVGRSSEVRLIAPVGPKFGKVEVRIGSSQWYPVDLHAAKRGTAQLLVRDEYSLLQGGTIRIRVVSLPTKGSVRLDAYVARK